MAAGVVRVANHMGISIPEELSVAGCDDISLAKLIFPSLTTIRQPLRAMSEAASRALIDGSRGAPRDPGLETISATLQIRDSTGPVPASAGSLSHETDAIQVQGDR
jgi:LacI family transcriptional regulator